MSKKRVIYLFFALLIGLVASQFFSTLIYEWIKPSSFMNDKNASLLPGIWSGIFSVTVIPLFEEWIFREKLLGFFKKYLPSSPSIIFSSLAFSVVHGQLYFVPFFIAGVIYSIARLMTGRWWFSVLLHSSYNAVCLIVLMMEVFLS